jgi:hypothetical protein
MKKAEGHVSMAHQPRPPARRSGCIPALPYPPAGPRRILHPPAPARKRKILTGLPVTFHRLTLAASVPMVITRATSERRFSEHAV